MKPFSTQTRTGVREKVKQKRKYRKEIRRRESWLGGELGGHCVHLLNFVLVKNVRGQAWWYASLVKALLRDAEAGRPIWSA